NSNITIYLRNTGGKAVVLNAVYVDGVAYTYDNNLDATKKWTLRNTAGGQITDKSIGVGELALLIVYSDKPAAQSQQVTIVCTDGTTLSLSVRK
ncbi:MAG: hypothetical protein RMI53_06445, partial [Nitrososphaerota archaeon]|nr:hypothetical protein [Nitrososphaerota archaeon]